MNALRLTSNLVMATVGLALFLGGLVAMQVELTPFLSTDGSVQWRIQEIAAGRTDYGLSTSSREMALADCRRATLSLEVRLQPSATRSAVYSNCLALSDGFAAIQPTLSVAWLTGAVAAAQLEDWQGFTLRMSKSLLSAPNEQWVAEMRISIAEKYYDHLTEVLRVGNEADMVLLTDDDAGLLSLARVFVAYPPSQDRIMALIRTRDEFIQQKFQWRLERALEEAKS